MKKILYILVFMIAVTGCHSYDAYYNDNKKDVLREKPFNKYVDSAVFVDSISNVDFVILISKENHLFYLPYSKMNLITEDMNEQTIFKISEAGLFDWLFRFHGFIPTHDRQILYNSGKGEYLCRFSKDEIKKIEHVELVPFTRNFSIVPVELPPCVVFRYLVRGDRYQSELRYCVEIWDDEGWYNFEYCRPWEGPEYKRAIDNPKINQLKFINPYAFYPLYVPMFGGHDYCK